MAREDKRRIYLQGLRSFGVVPQIVHLVPTTALVSGHFSPRDRENIMSFSPELFQQVANSAKISTNKRLDVVEKVTRFYPTKQLAESSVLQPRVIPHELLQFVVPNSLVERGVSGRATGLAKQTVDRVREAAALTIEAQAAACTRLTINTLIGVAVSTTLMARSKHRIAKLKTEQEISLESQIVP